MSKHNSTSSKNQLRQILNEFVRLRVIFFVAFVVVIYSFIVWRVDILTKVQPSEGSVAAQESASANPHIDPTTVSKIKQLQDNSVSVQTLFNQARQNPFQE
jgi:hypothetical protein